MGASWGLGMSVCVPPLGPLLGRSGGSLGPSWRALGLSGGPRGPSRGSLGGLLSRLVAICGAYWAVWERREAEKAETRQSTTHPRDIHDVCFLGPYWECSWRPLGACWRPPGPSVGNLGRLGTIFRRLVALSDRLGGLSGTSGPVLGPSWGGLWSSSSLSSSSSLGVPLLPRLLPSTPSAGIARADPADRRPFGLRVLRWGCLERLWGAFAPPEAGPTIA